ncbi:MAG: 50S ribosomal protein L11 methyltransferase [Polyangiales bacterium]
MSNPGHPFVTIHVRAEQVELAQLLLWELGATGLEERDQTTIVRGSLTGASVIIAAFSDEVSAQRAFDEIRGEYKAEMTYVPQEDWATEWRRGFGAQRIGKRLLLHPSWEPADSEPGDVVLTIDPENAFGSGDHETTRLVLQVLDERVRGGERVLDVGCGSGVLSIAAVRLGAASAVGTDIDADAVAVARRNANLNGVADRASFSTEPLAELPGLSDIVLANIETRVLVQMPGDLQAHLAEDGVLVLSGILRTEREDLLAAYPTMKLEACFEEGEWCACVLRSEGS